MSAKDYQICPALFNAYIAKVSKKNPNKMTDDRKVIEEDEIMGLIDWWLDKNSDAGEHGVAFESHLREGLKVHVEFKKVKSINYDCKRKELNMKELSIEEKAKRYDKALGKARQLCAYPTSKPFISDLQDIFPELSEPEDEKIRNGIIKSIMDLNSDWLELHGVTKEDAIIWLEKQGEQRPTIFIPKFCVGDKLVSTKNPRLTYEVLEVGHINELGNLEYKVEIFTDGKGSNPRNIHDMECHKVDEWAKLIEQKPPDKVE